MAAINVKTANSSISRYDLLSWLNDTLSVNYTKIEDLCTGVAYCQMMDILFPGQVQMKRVKLQTNQEYEYINNYKVLQTAFGKLKVDKVIPVDRLVKGRFQDNLEFLQWFQKFFETNNNGGDKLDLPARGTVESTIGSPVGKQSGRGSNAPSARKPKSNEPKAIRAGRALQQQQQQQQQKQQPEEEPVQQDNLEMAGDHLNLSSATPTPSASDAQLSEEPRDFDTNCDMQDLERENIENSEVIDSLERERDNFYGILREIENLSHATAEQLERPHPLIQTVLEVLYEQTDEFLITTESDGGMPPEAGVVDVESGETLDDFEMLNSLETSSSYAEMHLDESDNIDDAEIEQYIAPSRRTVAGRTAAGRTAAGRGEQQISVTDLQGNENQYYGAGSDEVDHDAAEAEEDSADGEEPDVESKDESEEEE